METNIRLLIDFNKVDSLLERFNKSTGFVTAILDLEGNVLSKSGWRQICTEFHRVHPDTSKNCTISDTELSNKMAKGEKYHFYKCLNGLVDVAVPIVINGEHVANLFSGQFFFEEPEKELFIKQAKMYGFNESKYLNALYKVPVVSKEKVKSTMDFLHEMTQFISDQAYQKKELTDLSKELRENQAKFKSVFESANVGKSITLITGEIDVNRAFCDMLGYTPEELQNKKWQDLTPEDEIPAIQALTEPLIEGEKDSVRFEKRYICKNGSHIWADVNVTIQRNEKGTPLYFITTVIDITERKHAEELKRISEERFRIAQEMSPDGFTILHPVRNEKGEVFDFTWVYENQAIAHINGTDPKDAIGKQLLNLFPSHQGTDVFKAYLNVANTRETQILEEVYAGEILSKPTWLRLAIVSMGDEIAILANNITERKQLELEKQKFFLLAESSSEFIGMCDLNMQPLYVNPAGRRMVGLPDMEAACSVKVQDYYFPEDQKFIAEEFFPRVLKDGHGDVEIRLRHFQTGEAIWMYYYLFSVCDASGKAIGWATVSHDISERRQADKELAEKSFLLSESQRIAHIGSYSWDMYSGKILWSDECYRLYGVNPETFNVTAESGIKCIYPDDQAIAQGWVMDMLAGKNPYPVTYRTNWPDGSIHWLVTNGIVHRGADGTPMQMIGTIQDITERKQTEDKIIESEKRYRSLFENMNAGFVLFEVVRNEQCTPVDLIIVAANEGFEKTTGLNLKAAVGKHLTKVLPGIEKDEADWIGRYSKVALTGKPIHFEQGSELLGYYFSVSAFQAAPNQCAVTFLDITERKQTEEKLKKSEARFRKLFDDGAVGMVLAGRDFKFHNTNLTFCQMTGYTEEELRQLTFAQITHPDDVAKDLDNVKKMLLQETNVYRTEKRYIKKDGEIFWAQLTVSPIIDTAGQFLYFVGIIVDVTLSKMAEFRIQESEERLRLATEQSNVAVWEYDFKTNSMSRSSNHDKLYGLEWQSKWDINTFLNATHPDDREYSNTIIQNSVAPGGPDNYTFDFRVVFPDGLIRWLLVKGRVIERDENGQGLTVRGTLTDITERKQTEEEIKQLNAELELKVEQRTAKLEAVNKELEAFSYSVSHDLRAPLRHINGYVDMLNNKYRETLNDKARHYLDTITGASRQMGTLIDDLLQFSRTGRREISNTEVNLNELLKEVMKELSSVTEGRTVEWDIQQLPEVIGDYSLLKLVWTNLLDNALKYTRKQPSAKISVGFKTEGKDFVFCVCDNGVGFDMKYANKLFGVFQRLHSQTEFEGTGIGLANVQRIILKHNGRVWAEAEPGKGAKFYFSLPK